MATRPEKPVSDVNRHSELYLDTIVFEVQGTLFKIPHSGLSGDATALATRFLLTDSADGDASGSSDANPIRLDAYITVFDFTSFVKAVGPPSGQEQLNLSLDEWMSVLKLAKLWNLADTRQRANSQAERIMSKSTPLEKILLGRKHGVIQWIKNGYKAIACREGGLTPEEKESLDLETRYALLELRDRVWAWTVANYPYSSDAAASSCKATFTDWEVAMLQIFADELRDGPLC